MNDFDPDYFAIDFQRHRPVHIVPTDFDMKQQEENELKKDMLKLDDFIYENILTTINPYEYNFE